MPLVIPPGFAQVTVPLKHAAMARPAAITFGVDAAAAPLDTANEVRDAIFATSSLADMIDADVLVGPVVALIGQDGAPPLVSVASVSNFGRGAFTTPPPNVAVLVRKRTNLGGRRNRGRFYVPWSIGEGNVDETGTIGSATRTQYQTLMTNFLFALGTEGVPMYVLHGTGQTLVPSPTIVATLEVDAVVATQRRRLR